MAQTDSSRRDVKEVLLEATPPASVEVAAPPSHAAGAGSSSPSGGRASVLLFAAVGLCSVSPLLFGFSLSFTAPTQITMEGDAEGGIVAPTWLREFTQNTEKWYASLFNVGAVLGAFSGSALSDRFGRRRTLAFTALPHAAAMLGTALAGDALVLTLLRMLSGWAVGIGSAVTPCYIGEIAPTELRGALGAVNQLSITAGIFFVSLLGSYVFVEEYEGQVFSDWRNLAWFGFAVSLLLLGMLCMPESPQWLAKRGDLEGAKAALRRLRTGDVTAEAERALTFAATPATSAAAAGSEDAVSAQAATSLGHYSRSLVVGVGLCLFQQFSGANAIMMYTTKICQDAGVPNAQLSAMVSMAAQVALTAVACTLVERAGRRPLLLFATTTMCVSHLLLSYYYVASSHGFWAPSWLAILALATFIVGFSLGMGPIPWLILAEIFPTEVRGTASSIATAVNWGSSFLVCLCFQPLEDALTRQGCFFLFATICLACFIFVKLLVPETKGKAVDEVLATMNSKRRGVRDIPMADSAAHIP